MALADAFGNPAPVSGPTEVRLQVSGESVAGFGPTRASQLTLTVLAGQSKVSTRYGINSLQSTYIKLVGLAAVQVMGTFTP